MKRYIDRDKLVGVIEKAMFEAKSGMYTDEKSLQTTLNLLNNFKYMVKTMEFIEIVEKGDI